MQTELKTKRQNLFIDWIIRLFKGIIIGIGFILPGLSGGVLAVILGVYDRIIKFLSNLRKDFIEQTSMKLIKNYDVVVVETLSLKSMAMSNHGKSVSDIGYGNFISRLKTKAIENDKTVLEASKWFASTQTCNVCGFKNKETKDLSVRKWICPECKTHHDRDINSAINLKKLGLNYVLSERQEFKSVESKIPELALLALNLDVEAENLARESKKHSDLRSL